MARRESRQPLGSKELIAPTKIGAETESVLRTLILPQLEALTPKTVVYVLYETGDGTGGTFALYQE